MGNKIYLHAVVVGTDVSITNALDRFFLIIWPVTIIIFYNISTRHPFVPSLSMASGDNKRTPPIGTRLSCDSNFGEHFHINYDSKLNALKKQYIFVHFCAQKSIRFFSRLNYVC